MKKNYVSFFLMLPVLAAFVFTGCKTYVSKDAIKHSLANLENCLKGCDAKLEAYYNAVDLCILHYETTNPFAQRLAACNHDTKCEKEIYDQIRSRCEAENKNLKDEYEKCKQDCLNTFPLELGIKN